MASIVPDVRYALGQFLKAGIAFLLRVEDGPGRSGVGEVVDDDVGGSHRQWSGR
jgi:hypothetical protein